MLILLIPINKVLTFEFNHSAVLYIHHKLIAFEVSNLATFFNSNVEEKRRPNYQPIRVKSN